jgi:hypothetical protein
MTTAALLQTRPAPVLDFGLVRTGFAYVAGLCAVLAPFSTVPLEFAVGGAVPWLIMRIIGIPTMPAALVYFFVWQWLQVFARAPQAWIDGESLSRGLYGPNVTRAYWYMMASLVVLALVFRLVLGSVKPATPAERTAHYKWQVNDLLRLFIAASIFAVVVAMAARFVPGAQQPLGALGQVKIVALFMLFTYVLSTGRGTKVMLGVVLFEIASGFSGFLSDFRSVFIFLAIAAFAARVKWSGTLAVGATIGLIVVLTLSLFWTSVKMDYRQFAAQSDESQAIVVPLSDRLAYLGSKALSPDIDLSKASYLLLIRLAYVDIFGSVIDVQEASPEPMAMRQWREAIGHVLAPRILFPGKAELSDSEVYTRLARGFTFEDIRMGTSISVGYMGEIFADMGFPGMLAGIAFLGFMIAGVIRLILTFQMPLIMREGCVMAFIANVATTGMEISLPKLLGAMFMFFLVFMMLNKFLFPKVVIWLDRRSAFARLRHS